MQGLDKESQELPEGSPHPDGTIGKSAPTVHLTPGLVARAVAKIDKGTLPRPAQYKDEYEWYADWSRVNGVSLPPDVPELRKLRNFIDNKVKRYRAGQLTQQAKEMMALHGIDLSEYSATNTGSGERESDEPRIAQMRALHEATGSYDLSAGTDPGLLAWQEKLLYNFSAGGRSGRMKRIEAQLPGLRYPLWRKPGEPLPKIDRTWMAMADRVRDCSGEYPVFRGELHPRMPADLAQWCRTQQEQASSSRGTLSPAQKGVLRDLEILDKPSRKVNAQRLQLDQALGIKAKLPSSDRHLNTFLGAAAFVRYMLMGKPVTAYYVWFGLSPAELERLNLVIQKARVQLLQLIVSSAKSELATVKRLEAQTPGFFKPNNARKLENPAKRPAILSDVALQLGTIIESIRANCEKAQIRQNLAI